MRLELRSRLDGLKSGSETSDREGSCRRWTVCRGTAPTDLPGRSDARELILRCWQRFDPDYERARAPFKTRCGELSNALDARQRAGDPMIRSDQIRNEAKWLLNYRADWTRLRQRLDDLEASLGIADPGQLAQDDDGSWGGAAQEFYRRLEPTVDALQSSRFDLSTTRPLTFLAPLTDPDRLRGYLWRLQTSDIGTTGQNHRDELGSVQASLSQMFYKDELRDLLAEPRLGFAITPEMEEAYGDFMAQTQHPRTGYWGPWYRDVEAVLPFPDLSFTFHHVSYRDGAVGNWSAVMATTLALRDGIYPNGWRPEGGARYSDHNNYDVAQILFHGWPHVTRETKLAARSAIVDMLTWCLTTSVNGGAFTLGDPIDAFYFGVRFLDRVGYWDDAKRFWSRSSIPTPKGLPTPGRLARNLAANFAGLNAHSEWAETVTSLLRAACCATPEDAMV